MKGVKLKLGTHMDNGLMYVYTRIRAKGLLITLGVTSLDRFYNLPLTALVCLVMRLKLYT